MPILDDEQPPRRVGAIVDDETPAAPPQAKNINDLVRMVGENQRAVKLERGVTVGDIARTGANIFLGGSMDDVTAPPTGPWAQTAEEALQTPGKVAQFTYEHPRQAAGTAAAMAPGALLALATGGQSIPAQALAQLAGGVLGEGARQVITGEPKDPRLLAGAGVAQAIPITGGPAAAAVKGGLVSLADLTYRTNVTEGRMPTAEEAGMAAVIGGGAAGLLTKGAQVLEQHQARLGQARQRIREDAVSVAGGTEFPDVWTTGTQGPSPQPPAQPSFLTGRIIDDERLTGAPPPVPNLAPRPPEPFTGARTGPLDNLGARPAFPMTGAIVDDEAGPLAAAAAGPAPMAPPVAAAQPAPALHGGGRIPAVELDNGTVVKGKPGQFHHEAAADAGVNLGDIKTTGWMSEDGQTYIPQQQTARETSPAKLSTVVSNQVEGPPPPPHVVGPDANVYRVPIGDLATDPERFQPRRNYGKGGATGRLAGVEQYHDPSAGNLVTWRDPADGRLYVIDGHNRLERFRELGVPDVRVIELHVGTAAEAKVEGALINMRQGTFDAVDVANVVRETGLTPEMIRAAGVPMTRKEMLDGLALSNLHPALFGMAARGEMPLSRAVAIGRELAGGAAETHAQQIALVKLLSGRKAELSDKEVVELIRQTKLAPTTTETQTDLFGSEQVTKSLAIERAQVVSGVADELMRDKRLFGYVGQEERAARLAQEGGGVKPERAREIAQQAAQVGEMFSRLANRQGPVADAVSNAAREIAQGARVQEAIARALPAIREAVASELPGGAAAGALGATAEGAGGPQSSLFGALAQKLGEEKGSIGVVPPRLRDFLARGAARVRGYTQGLRSEAAKLEAEALQEELDNARRRPFPGAVGRRGYGPGVQVAPGSDRSIPAARGAMSSVDRDSFSPSQIRGDIDNVMNRVGLVNRDDVEFARRGVVPVKLTQMRADEIAGEWAKRIGADPAMVARLRERGQLPNAEEMLAMIHLSDRYGARALRRAAIAEKTGSLEDTLKAVADAATASSMFIQAQAARTEIGRAMNILRAAAYGPGGPGAQNAAIRKAVQYFGGTDQLEEIVKRIRMFRPEEIDQLNRYMATVAPKKWGDKALAVYYFSLLGNVPGRVVDFLSTGLFSLRRPVERLAAAGIDTALSAARGTPRTRFAADAGYDLIGHYMGIRRGVRNALRTLITQMPAEGFSRFREVESAVRPFRSELANTIVGVPRSIIEASDEFHKTLTYTGYLYGEAARIARTEGRTGQAFVDRMAEIIEDPHTIDGLYDRARFERLYRTFQDPLGPLGQKFLSVINYEVPDNPYVPWLAGLRPLRFPMPFFRTTVKLQKLGLGDVFRAPGMVAKTVAGRLPKEQGELADELARTLIGASIAGAAMAYAAEGYLTGGGPLDPRQADVLRQTGWAPNSINFGGTSQYEYRKMEPFGTTLGVVADLYDGWPVMEEEDSAQRITDYVSRMATYTSAAGTTLGSALLKQAINAPYVKGLSDLYDAMDDPKRYGQAFVNSQVAAFIPGIVKQVAIANEPTIRKPRTLLQTLQSRVPGLTQGWEAKDMNLIPGIGEIGGGRLPTIPAAPEVPPLIDIWGRDVVRQGGFWEILLSPVNRRELYNDPASQAIRELGWKPGSPRRALTFEGLPLPLSDQQYTQYARRVGSIAFDQVTEVVTSGEWKDLPDRAKRSILSDIWKTARGIAKDELMETMTPQIEEAASKAEAAYR